MSDNYERFIEFSVASCSSFDYSDKQKVKAHNQASKNLQKLKTTMLEETDKSAGVFLRLLSHHNDAVRLNAASICVNEAICVKEAKKTLLDLIEITDNEILRFSAKMSLRQLEQR